MRCALWSVATALLGFALGLWRGRLSATRAARALEVAVNDLKATVDRL